MTAQIGTLSLRGLFHEDFQYPFLVSGGVLVTSASVGLAMSQDTTAANTVKLVRDGESIMGRLEIYEDRTVEGIVVGTVGLQGGLKFLVDPTATDSPDETPAVGDYLVGATTTGGLYGYVRKATSVELAAGGLSLWRVVEAADDGLSVVAIKV